MLSRRDIEAMLAEEPALWALPSKFGILVDGGGVLPLHDITADIMVRAGETGLAVHLDGGTLAARCGSILPRRNCEGIRACLPSPVGAAERSSAAHARAGDGGWRGGDLRRGWPCRRPRDSARLTPEGKSPIGLISLADQARNAFGVGLPFGRIEANALHALADISERYGDGSVRTTPWRALLLTGVSASDEMTPA